MGSMIAVLVLMGLALFLFVTELVRVDLVGMGLMVAIALLGLVPPEQAFAGFAHPALLTVAAMFVLAAGLNRTGALAFVADRLIRASRGGPLLLLLLLMITAAVMSAFINNTTVVVIMIPLVISLAQKFGTSPSRLLMPLSFASILGGTCTLIGTSTNLLVSGLAVDAGHAPLGMFELAPIGLAFTAVGITYMVLFGRFLLPDRRPVSAALQGSTHREYLTEIQVGAGSSLVGSTLAESVLSRHPDLAILQVVRGEQILWPPLDKVVIQAGDVLMSRGPVSTIVSVQSEDSLEILPELARGHLRFDPTAATLAEVVILPNSPLVGVQVGDARFRRLYGVVVMALQRRGAHFRDKVTEMELRAGDILLLYGDENAVDKLEAVDEFILLERQRALQPPRSRALWALGILAAVVLAATTTLVPLLPAAMAGALLMVLTGCVSPREVYNAIDFKLLVLIAGALGLGAALEATGTASAIAGELVQLTAGIGLYAVLAAVYLMTTLCTEMLSNNAAAVLMVPIALSTADTLGVDTRPFLVAVTIAASASFATPIGYQTNTLVYGAGGYRFADFMRVGAPLNILLWIMATLLIPLIWSF
jgi:di/tricarboxylate transporter